MTENLNASQPFDTNIQNYTLSELLTIFNLSEQPTSQEIIENTNQYIEQANQSNNDSFSFINGFLVTGFNLNPSSNLSIHIQIKPQDTTRAYLALIKFGLKTLLYNILFLICLIFFIYLCSSQNNQPRFSFHATWNFSM